MIVARTPGNFGLGLITQRNPASFGLRGLGAGIGPGTLNCPGDPGCPGNQVAPLPDSSFLDAVGTWTGAITGAQLAANPPALYPTGAGAWFAQNQSAVLFGVGILVLLSFMSEGRR